ncbi:MAG TPA: hypothetical protein VF373_09440 [Prolixibacteraceae bacterium]
MNCCGNKRKEWLNEVKSSTQQEITGNFQDTIVSERPDRIFEYTGNSSFKIAGVSSGKTYQFRFKGDKTVVDYNDSFALMAERDLKISSTR